MHVPGFVAEASRYTSRVSYGHRSRPDSGAGIGRVTPQWDMCFPCRPSGFQRCCSYSPPGPALCNDYVPCPTCTPGCSPCALDPHSATRGGGTRTCWDAQCRISTQTCQFCNFRPGHPELCHSACSRNCQPTDQDCLERCACCCRNATRAGICEDCFEGTWEGRLNDGQCITPLPR